MTLRYKKGEEVVFEGGLYKVLGIWDKEARIYELKDQDGDIIDIHEDEFYSLDKMTKKELKTLVKNMLKERA